MVIEILSLVPPDPVSQVECPVQAQKEQVVGSDSLSFASLADHEELGQDGHRFQVDGESPEDLSQGPRREVARGGWSGPRRGPSLKELLKCAYRGEYSEVKNQVLNDF